MALIKVIHSADMLIDEFQQWELRKDQFTFNALCALFEYITESEEDVELDVIALCCGWTEYESGEVACGEHGVKTLGELQGKTTVIRFDGGILVGKY